ncbi:hypothetical protein WT12_08435 [Burkholderia territorii]|uniref:hypothetical protein n=1 Tax=Burkholderia territorii TaxID=1503055 RepID=UPI0007522DA6|nr:hypothetical protein [Burkholderia territorii]KVN48763.1 hypothetical protein WT12_08435 [Burkholderia territorii]
MRRFVKLFVTAVLAVGVYGSASAQQSALPGIFIANFSGDIQEPDFPCALIICFANPAGATAEPKCGTPVNWLIDNFIKKFRPWPQCIFKDPFGTQVTYANQAHVACPAGFTAETTSSAVIWGMNNFTGVCLRPVPTCETTGRNAFSPTVNGSACYTYNIYNDYGSIVQSYHYEYVIPPNGVTTYSMHISNSTYNNTFYFNLGGNGTGNLSQSIIYKKDPYANNGQSYGNAFSRFGTNH